MVPHDSVPLGRGKHSGAMCPHTVNNLHFPKGHLTAAPVTPNVEPFPLEMHFRAHACFPDCFLRAPGRQLARLARGRFTAVGRVLSDSGRLSTLRRGACLRGRTPHAALACLSHAAAPVFIKCQTVPPDIRVLYLKTSGQYGLILITFSISQRGTL